MGQKCILLVDDNDQLRLTLAEQLTQAGYAVREAKDTETASRLFAIDSAVDLLLTDFRLEEKKTGVELAYDLVSERPGLPVLVLTGYPTEADNASRGRFKILSKPMQKAMLVKEIETALARA